MRDYSRQMLKTNLKLYQEFDIHCTIGPHKKRPSYLHEGRFSFVQIT